MLGMALIGLWLAWGGDVTANVTSAGPTRRAPLVAHHCKCGMNCGATCCCTPKGSVDPPIAPERSPARPRPDVERVANPPCMTSAPCGGALPPSSGPLVRLCEPADRTALMGTPPTHSGPLLAPPASDRAEAPAGSRVDEPPERLADA